MPVAVTIISRGALEFWPDSSMGTQQFIVTSSSGSAKILMQPIKKAGLKRDLRQDGWDTLLLFEDADRCGY